MGRSGLVTAGILIALLVCFGLYWMAHRRGQFHKLRTHEIPPTASVPMPGGQEPVVLSRLSLLNNTVPEFVSVTLLPGIDMQLMQIMASSPGQDGYPLLQAPTLEEAATAQPTTLQVAPVHLFASRSPISAGSATAASDVIAPLVTNGVETDTLPDGGQATAKFSALTGPNGGVSATMTTVLNGHTIDLTVVARNESTGERYVTFAWAPRFAYSGNDAARTTLSVPSTQIWRDLSKSGARHAVTGELAEDLNFTGTNGHNLSDRPVDATFVQLRSEFLADGPAVRLFDRQNGAMLRITAFSPGIRSLHVQTDPVSHTLLLGFNSFDPAAARHDQDEAIHPGQTVQWHLRLEILPFSAANGTDTLPAPYRND